MSAPRPVGQPTPLARERAEHARSRLGEAGRHAAGPSAELFVAALGLFLFTGLPASLAPSEFRLLKHVFHAWIMVLLLLRWRASLRVLTRDRALCFLAVLVLASCLWSEFPVWGFKRGAVIVQTTAFGLYLASRFSLDDQLRAFAWALVLLLAAFAASALLDPVGAFSTPGAEGAFLGPLSRPNPVARLIQGVVMVQAIALGLYFASRHSLDAQVRAFAWVLAGLLAALVALALFDLVWNVSTPVPEGAFRGPLVHKNHVGRLMALAIPALVLWTRGAPRPRWPLAVALASALLFLVLARSLAGALMAAMLCSVVAAERWARPFGARILLLPVLVVALATAAATAGGIDGVLIALGKDPTLTGRTEIWRTTLGLVAQRPLLGHSIASFWQLEIVAMTGKWFSHAHNGYLQLLIDLGAIGLATFLVQLLTTLRRALSWAQRRDRAALWPYCLAAFLLAYNLIEVSVAEENSIVWVLYVAAGLAVRAPSPRRPLLVDASRSRPRGRRGVQA